MCQGPGGVMGHLADGSFLEVMNAAGAGGGEGE